jgi:hypothetical protein
MTKKGRGVCKVRVDCVEHEAHDRHSERSEESPYFVNAGTETSLAHERNAGILWLRLRMTVDEGVPGEADALWE